MNGHHSGGRALQKGPEGSDHLTHTAWKGEAPTGPGGSPGSREGMWTRASRGAGAAGAEVRGAGGGSPSMTASHGASGRVSSNPCFCPVTANLSSDRSCPLALFAPFPQRALQVSLTLCSQRSARGPAQTVTGCVSRARGMSTKVELRAQRSDCVVPPSAGPHPVTDLNLAGEESRGIAALLGAGPGWREGAQGLRWGEWGDHSRSRCFCPSLGWAERADGSRLGAGGAVRNETHR